MKSLVRFLLLLLYCNAFVIHSNKKKTHTHTLVTPHEHGDLQTENRFRSFLHVFFSIKLENCMSCTGRSKFFSIKNKNPLSPVFRCFCVIISEVTYLNFLTFHFLLFHRYICRLIVLKKKSR